MKLRIIAGDVKTMNTLILAEITSMWSPMGMLSVVGVLCLIIAAIAYAFGPWSGSCTCLLLLFFCIFALGPGEGGSNGGGGGIAYSANRRMIANRDQTRIIEKGKHNISDPDCIFYIDTMGTQTPLDDEQLFIPAEEMTEIFGRYHMSATGKEVDISKDGYIYNEPYSPANVAKEYGGMGIPIWLYHPGGPIWVFGIGALPALLGGMFVASRVL